MPFFKRKRECDGVSGWQFILKWFREKKIIYTVSKLSRSFQNFKSYKNIRREANSEAQEIIATIPYKSHVFDISMTSHRHQSHMHGTLLNDSLQTVLTFNSVCIIKCPLGWEMATHSRILAWKKPWTEEPGGV